MKWLPTRKNKIEAFWRWFEKNEETYFELAEENREELFDELQQKLQKVNKHLVFEFSAEPENGKREFIISADGMVEAFDAVFDLQEAAPELERFEIIAFRQPSLEEFSVHYGNKELTWEDVYYTALQDIEQEEVNMMLYIKGLTEENEEEIIPLVFILLDSVIGEYNTGVHVGRVEFHPFEAHPNARPLHTLKEFFPVESS
ncbi:hypothetical protein ACSFXN_17575 [Planococcus sp. 1R117A]|uniref:hypothetical protein n=1 Tax=Planococcus sp. 1R117A TaxID=3447020 RepID=UPI003EDBED0A